MSWNVIASFPADNPWLGPHADGVTRLSGRDHDPGPGRKARLYRVTCLSRARAAAHRLKRDGRFLVTLCEENP